MPVGARLRPSVLAAREQLAEGREQLRQQHDRGLDGVKVCARFTSLVDSAIARLYDAALADRPEREAAELRERVALVAHGGYGRRQQAPYSDVDMMMLYDGKVDETIADFARRLTQDIFDVGIQLGQSVRTTPQAVQMARDRAADRHVADRIAAAAGQLGGVRPLPRRSSRRWSSETGGRMGRDFIAERRTERLQYGETVYLLEPNVKRSRGGLRDIHLLRWLWYLRCGVADFDRLHDMGVLSKFDHRRLISSQTFLLRVRNEMHFHAGEACDLLTRAEQLRLAEYFQYRGRAGDAAGRAVHARLFPPHESRLAPGPSAVGDGAAAVAGEPRVRAGAGPHDRRTTTTSAAARSARRAKALARLELHLEEVLRLVELARTEGKRISQDTWYFVYRTAPQYSNVLSRRRPRQVSQDARRSGAAGRAAAAAARSWACWKRSFRSLPTPGACCSSISTTSTRSTSTAFAPWRKRRSSPSGRTRWAKPTPICRTSGCCTWRC